MIRGKKILCAGFAGSIGSELFRQLAPHNELYGIDLDETRMFDLLEELKLKGYKVSGRVGDIKAHSTVEDSIRLFSPDIIFNAAARKHVSAMEWSPLEAVHTNILGTFNLLKYAQRYNVKKFVNISTDKVVNANSIMGATKKVAEIMVKNAGGVSVRFGNVMDSRGSLLPIWKRQFDAGEPLTITDERMERYFMSIPDAVKLVICAAEVGEPGKILILDMGQLKKIVDLKQELYGDYPTRIIGIRDGETLSEKIMTQEEEQRAVRHGNFWIL